MRSRFCPASIPPASTTLFCASKARAISEVVIPLCAMTDGLTDTSMVGVCIP